MRTLPGIIAAITPIAVAPAPAIQDTFDRANNNNLGTSSDGLFSWTRVFGGATEGRILVNTYYSPSNGENRQRAGFDLGTPDHFSQLDGVFYDGTGGSDSAFGPAVRFNASADSCYFANVMLLRATNVLRYQIWKATASVETKLGADVDVGSESLPVTVRLEAEGNDLRLYGRGVLIMTPTDSSFPSNTRVGISCNPGLSFACDNFAAGTL